ncbi:hypothetical protein DXV76_11020 [Rhodobacteraceae bacterium CCMM004]|nr:hypothetical protein DXV76_11020 [Rhodobacteraceae bacterium CCMM004]
MRIITSGAAVLLATTSMAAALGLDRSAQDIGLLFEDGGIAELSFGHVMPSVDGNDVAVFGGQPSGNVAQDYTIWGLGVKADLTPDLSFAVIVDEPYGTDISYPVPGSVALGGTRAIVDSHAITALARYKFTDNFSVHGGLRYQQISANVSLGGLAYGPAALPTLNGYNASFDGDDAWGYVIGGAYERPDIALRVALTYNSAITHELPTVETVQGIPVSILSGGALPATSTTTVRSPESLNLDFQTGIAPDTLLFGSIRYARYEQTIVSPQFFDSAVGGPNSSLTDIESGFGYSLGLGRRFNDKLSGSITVGYEEESDPLVSPLSPTNGRYSLALGMAYNVTDNFVVSGGASYTWLGDAQPETGTPDVARASFTDNDAFAIGIKLGYKF